MFVACAWCSAGLLVPLTSTGPHLCSNCDRAAHMGIECHGWTLSEHKVPPRIEPPQPAGLTALRRRLYHWHDRNRWWIYWWAPYWDRVVDAWLCLSGKASVDRDW
jgi:hypothetical protein